MAPLLCSVRMTARSMLCRNGSISGFAELVLADAAERAYPVFRKIFKGGSRSDAVVRIADSRIILITADITYILIHRAVSFQRDEYFAESLFCRFPYCTRNGLQMQ